MIIQKQKWSKCKCCNQRKEVIKPELYGCDSCKTPIGMELDSNGSNQFLEITVFHNDHEKDTDNLQFCSWACVLQKLKTIKTDNFISLPYMLADTREGQTIEDFWKAVRQFKD